MLIAVLWVVAMRETIRTGNQSQFQGAFSIFQTLNARFPMQFSFTNIFAIFSPISVNKLNKFQTDRLNAPG